MHGAEVLLLLSLLMPPMLRRRPSNVQASSWPVLPWYTSAKARCLGDQLRWHQCGVAICGSYFLR